MPEELVRRHAALFLEADKLRRDNRQASEINDLLTHALTESYEELIFLRDLAESFCFIKKTKCSWRSSGHLSTRSKPATRTPADTASVSRSTRNDWRNRSDWTTGRVSLSIDPASCETWESSA